MLANSDYSVTEALRLFSRFGIEVAFMVPTRTGLEKSIMDATSPVREFLRNTGLHNYEGQAQGRDGKNYLPAFLVRGTVLEETRASLYRPKAKGGAGDPRIWFSKLPKYAKPDNLLAIFAFEGSLYVVNMSDKNVRDSFKTENSPVREIISQLKTDSNKIAEELLLKLRAIHKKGWIKTITSGDTGVGVTLEDQLGIRINSSQKPDYKGIELKSKRIRGNLRTTTRSNLFAQVPDWSISRLKSSAQILDTYGYMRGIERKLYCTVRASSPNTQNLMLQLDEPADLLHEIYCGERDPAYVASWPLALLMKRLREKHTETFWIGAESRGKGSNEEFLFKKVVHTRSPFLSLFGTLCSQDVITLDHLIKRDCSGRVTEKGPLFKIHSDNLDLLFPPPQEHGLA
ncbi:MvaI/BcnI family restriction endonuclease [Gammaproteobacteria bacterium]|nr:MvaI/BcnI family restriction endonuclease [Gammaproteobacteria bacterium]